jgi:hypothetical protein
MLELVMITAAEGREQQVMDIDDLSLRFIVNEPLSVSLYDLHR